jgi:hypothetical protein
MANGLEDAVIEAAQLAFSSRIKGSSDVSENTKNAQAIAKAWRSAVHRLDPDRFQIEALVAPELDQRIDVIDTEDRVAYEFKVSGKNAWAEFYKNVVKIIIWNETRSKKISGLVFITDQQYGRPCLEAPMPRAYAKYLAMQGLTVAFRYVTHDFGSTQRSLGS